MKRTKLGLLFVLSGTMILASCGGTQAPKAKKYNLTFHQTQPGEIEDVVVVVTKGKTTNADVWEQEPDINPKTGYTSEWEEYDVETMTEDLTVEPIYTAIEYTATFIDRVSGNTLGTDKFTVEDESLDYPALPEEKGYTYAWESVEISAQNLTVYCDRSVNQHTVKFFADDEKTQQVGETLTFSIETESLPLPDVPVKEGYDGSWPTIDFGCDKDLELIAQYELHSYYLQFKVNGENVGSPVGYHLADTWADVDKPEAPSITGYTVSWPESVTLEHAEQDNPQVINGIITANKYTVSYEGLSATTEVTYDSPYTLESAGSIVYGWFNGEDEVATSGDKWQIADNVTLSKMPVADTKILDFEDEHDKDLFSILRGFTSFEIAEGEGVGGSKALKFSRNNSAASDCQLTIEKDYLDLVFANENVKALAFYAKGTKVTNNFRHMKVDAQYVNNDTSIVHCYENNDSGFGITNEYKKFYLTRGVYSQMFSEVSGSNVLMQYNLGEGDFFIDNLQPVFTDYYDYTLNSFEFGSGIIQDGQETRIAGVGVNANGNKCYDFVVQNRDTSVPMEVSFDYDLHTDGIRSLKVTKTTQEVDFRLGAHFSYADLPDEGIYFDYYGTIPLNAAFRNNEDTDYRLGGLINDGFAGNQNNGGKPLLLPTNKVAPGKGVTVAANRWYTFHVLKSQINSGNGRFFAINNHASASSGTFYIDNIRLANKHVMNSFENAYAYFGGASDNTGGGAADFPVETVPGVNPPVVNNADYIFATRWSNTVSAEISDEIASEGQKSLKLVLKGSGSSLNLNSTYVNQLFKYPNAKIAFDVYSEDLADDKLSLTTGAGNVKSIVKGQWTTIELSKEDFHFDRYTTSEKYSDAGTFCEGNAFGAGTIYIDNIRLINAVY